MNPENTLRELQKISDVLELVDAFFAHRDQSNATLHMSAVRPSPLSSAVGTATSSLRTLIREMREDHGLS